MLLRRRILWTITILYWCLLFTATHVRLPHVATKVTDKTAHVVSYFILGMLLRMSLQVTKPQRRDLPLIVLAIGIAYGAIDEWIQAIPFIHRSCDILDWYADVAGVACAVVVFWLIASRFSRTAPG